jgi:hypothetical protein
VSYYWYEAEAIMGKSQKAVHKALTMIRQRLPFALIGSKIKRKYDTAQSPYQRLLAREDVHPILKEDLKNTYATLNVFALKRSIDKKIEQLFNLARKDSSVSIC